MFDDLIEQLKILCSYKITKDSIKNVHTILSTLDFDYNSFIKECNNQCFTIGSCVEFFALDLKTHKYKDVSRFLFPVVVFNNQELTINMYWDKNSFKWNDTDFVSDYVNR